MAKKKSKKMDLTKIVTVCVILALSVLTICTLFMPVFTSIVDSLIGSTSSSITGADAFSAAFNDEMSADLSAGANSLVLLKLAEETAFVTNVFLWGYMLTIIVSAVTLVFTVLSLLGLKFKLINSILGLALIILSIATFIFAIITAGKFASVDLGALVSGKTVIGFGIYMLIGTLIAGGTQVYNARR